MSNIKTEFRRAIDYLDDEFIVKMENIESYLDNIIEMVKNDEDKSTILSELESLKKEVV